MMTFYLYAGSPGGVRDVRHFSMKTKMVLAVSLLFVLVIVLLVWGALFYQEQALKKAISQQQFSLVSSLAANIDDKLGMAHNALIHTSRELPVEAVAAPDSAQRFLDARITLHSIFDNGLFLISREGRLVAESPFLAGRRGQDFTDLEFFHQTVTSGKPYISRPYTSRRTPGHPAIFLSAPIFDVHGQLIAILGGSFDLWGTNFLRELSQTRYGDVSYFSLTDRDRTIIVHPDPNRILTKESATGSNSLFEKALAGFDGNGETINDRGEPVITSVHHLQSTGWILTANHLAANAYAPLEEARSYFLQVALAFIVVVLTTTWLLMRKITAPLAAFTRHVEMLPTTFGRHDPLKFDGDDEIAIMAQTFNRMVATLENQQAALLKEKERFSLAFQAVPSVLAISSLADGRFMEINEAFERVMGYRRDEVVGRTSQELHLWEKREDRLLVAQRLARGEKVRGLEFNFRSKSGTEVIGLYSAETIELGGDHCILSLVNDITARKRAEQELRNNEERYRRLYKNTPVMLHSIDREGRLVNVSNYWLTTLGYKRKEVLGCNILDFLTEESQRYAAHVVLPEFFRTGGCKDVPYQMVKKNGEIMDILLSATVDKDDQGKFIRSLAVIIDVTDRKRAREKIEKLNTELAAHAIELEDANRELEAFNYSVSHDLRKPLTVINSYCQIIREMCGHTLDSNCQKYLQMIFDGTLRMNELIDALLRFSCIARQELHRETVDLSSIARAVIAELTMISSERQVTFRIADGIMANGDAKLLEVVMENLLGNAWKYTAIREDAVIEFDMADHDGHAAYFVRDNGSGFDMTDTKDLFTPFARLPGADKHKGHGIGLATVERIIRHHGGRIWAEGEMDKGATFYFTIAPPTDFTGNLPVHRPE